MLHLENGGVRHSIRTWLALEHTSQQAFERLRASAKQNFADSQAVSDLLSYHMTERVVSQYSGVEAIEHDMCPNQSCLAFTGLFADLDHCPLCNASHWDEAKLQTSGRRVKQGAQKALTIPLGPQLQAHYRHPESAHDMEYLHRRTEEILQEVQKSNMIPVIDDIAMEHDYLSAYLAGDIKPGDVILSISLDRAQLYKKKQSDYWIYIWIIHNLSPNKRYHKVNVLPGGFIPGPHKLKNIDSFLFAGLHHLAALQNEGLEIWDASSNTTFRSDPYLLYVTADGPGLVHLNGTVGHSGKNGCRMYCGVLGRCQEEGTHYYPALIKPRDHCTQGSNHPDIDVFHLPAGGQWDYTQNLFTIVGSATTRQCDVRKTETGLTKAPLILGLQPSRSLGIPLSMTTDIMHLVMNLSVLLIGLWCGSTPVKVSPSDHINSWDWAVLGTDQAWKAHGKAVEDTGPHLLGSFDCKPHNIADKLTSGYKTREFQLYTFGLGPVLLYGLLPDLYWRNYCKLVCGIQILCQHRITNADLVSAHILLCSWEREYEEIYYQFREDRLHLVRPCVHQVVHLTKETVLKGPPICYAQWTIKRTIGILGQEIRQLSNPYANISREGARRCKINALLTLLPELDCHPQKPSSATVDLGDGFMLKSMREAVASLPTGEDA
jgi:hypothetical protein